MANLREIPFISLNRLRRQASEAGCVGLRAFIDQIATDYFLRRGQGREFRDIPMFLDLSVVVAGRDEQPAFGAWDEMVTLIEERYDGREDLIDERSGNDDECDGLYNFRALVYIAETLPTMPKESRDLLDKVIGEMAEEFTVQVGLQQWTL